MKQRNLFAAQARPADAANDDYVRKSLERLLYTARAAERLPWSEGQTASWEKLFDELSRDLRDGDGAKLQSEFQAELSRLRAAT